MSMTKDQAIRAVREIKNVAIAANIDSKTTKDKLSAALVSIANKATKLEESLLT